MSAIRYFDNVPHVVRYGMHDDKTEKCWIWFWRNGVRFHISVDKEGVQDTMFYEQWKPLLREREHDQMPFSQGADSQWHPLCDLLISVAMSTLKQLAPDREYWTTLHDYLHTPSYRLRLFASGPHSEIVAKVEEGPTNTGAYDLEPVSQDTLPQPAGIQLYRSQDLLVLNKEKDWRRGPQKVSTKDGNIFFFLGCQRGSRDARTQQISNRSLDAIRAQLKLMKTRRPASPPEGIPQVYGIVTDNIGLEYTPESLSQESRLVDEAGNRDQRIAGILITWIPQSKNLVQSVPALAALHQDPSMDCTHRRDGWPYLNKYTVLVDAHGQAWLDVSYASWTADVSSEEAKEGDTADAVATKHLFEDWLPQEVAKKRSSA